MNDSAKKARNKRGGARVMVTGASGLIGRHACRELTARGYEVIAVSRRGPHGCDLLSATGREKLIATHRPEYLLHLAWVTAHGRFWSDPVNMDWLAASADLIARFHEAGGRRVVVSGTCAEYDWTQDCAKPLREDAPVAPATLYGTAKDALRRVLAAYGRETGLSWGWGRVFFLFGPGEDENRLIPAIARALAAGQPARLGSGRPVRDFWDARNVGAALAALLDSDVCGPVNISSGQGHSIADIARFMARLAGREDLLALGALPDRPGEPSCLLGDNRRLREEVGFIPPVGLEEGLRAALDHWRAAALQQRR